MAELAPSRISSSGHTGIHAIVKPYPLLLFLVVVRKWRDIYTVTRRHHRHTHGQSSYGTA
ncbi:hypothetical protein M438DRAFT_196210 [Aureobasidium pullulans EXF-150]|uniref:Uncharacterized protein n=1 Tax=Aureobasidium pullulans EXF-150 TaxID=1043002 RepID=A0A074XIX9_AURPU|nr:uncharacterized protein M438DRAFT_196210 [Aureobasidium pullulans EXF-150]KEQ85478.1 hypothetical protein M438DRAFT_196210 [Aureobasidium pullulans EXF-150]